MYTRCHSSGAAHQYILKGHLEVTWCAPDFISLIISISLIKYKTKLKRQGNKSPNTITYLCIGENREIVSCINNARKIHDENISRLFLITLSSTVLTISQSGSL